MNERNKSNDNQKLTVDLVELQGILSLGRQNSAEIGKKAGAVIRVGKRVLYYLPKIQEYLERLAE